jgi:hypothetical protein
MNERPIDLYKQATEFAYNSIGKEHSNTAYFQGTIAGKFAELIVQECIKLCEHRANNEEYDQYDMGMQVKAEDIKALINERFGVKE